MTRMKKCQLLLIFALCTLWLASAGETDECEAVENTTTVLQRCCPYRAGDPSVLWDCVKNETQRYSEILLHSEQQPIDMAVATYATDNIAGYAAYSMAVVAAWAQSQNYPMRIYTQADGAALDFDTYDPRWNKVPTIRHVLTSWAPSTKSAMWVDADLTVLSFATTLKDFENESSRAHLMICAENAGSTTFTNSGSVLARNSERTIDLLDLWWTIGNRTHLSDQEALDFVKKQLEMEGKAEELHILPTNFFNSDPPAMTKLMPTDRALHLMGTTTAYRAAIFGVALEEVCLAFDEQRSPAHQLGITRDLLLSMALRVHREEYDEALYTVRAKLAQGRELSDDELIYPAHGALSHALMNSGNPEEATRIMYEVRDVLIQAVDMVKRAGKMVPLHLLKQKVALSINCFDSPRPGEPLEEIFATLLEDMDYMQQHVIPSQLHAVILQRSIIEQAIVMNMISSNQIPQALERQFKIIDLLKRDDIMEHNQIKPYSVLAALLCMTGRHDEAMPYFAKLIELQTDHYGIHNLSTAAEYLNRGICLYEAGKYNEAMEDLTQAKRIYGQLDYPSSSVEVQRVNQFHELAKASVAKAKQPVHQFDPLTNASVSEAEL